MTTLIFALSLLATTDAGNAQLSREMRAELDADVILSTSAGLRLVLSASLCADKTRLADIDASIDLMPVPPAPLRRAWLLTADAIDAAELALDVLAVERQECGGDVKRIAECLGDVPGPECSGSEIAGEVAAALRLREVQR